MKKLLIGLVAALLMTGGLLATTTTTANADKYPRSVETSTKANPKNAKPGHAKIKAGVSADKGTPKGTLTFVFVNKRTGETKRFRVSAKDDTFDFELPPGRYSVQIRFTPVNEDSKFKPSSTSTDVKVERKKR